MRSSAGSSFLRARRAVQDGFDHFRQRFAAAPVTVKVVTVAALLIIVWLIGEYVKSLLGFVVGVLLVAGLVYGPFAVARGRRSVAASLSVAVLGLALVTIWYDTQGHQQQSAGALAAVLPFAVVAAAHAGSLGRWLIPCRTVAWALLWAVPVLFLAWPDPRPVAAGRGGPGLGPGGDGARLAAGQVDAGQPRVRARAVTLGRAGRPARRHPAPDPAPPEPARHPPRRPVRRHPPVWPRPGRPARRHTRRPGRRAGPRRPRRRPRPPARRRGRPDRRRPAAAAGHHRRRGHGRARRHDRPDRSEGPGQVHRRLHRGGPPPRPGRLRHREADAALRVHRPPGHRQDRRRPHHRQDLLRVRPAGGPGRGRGSPRRPGRRVPWRNGHQDQRARRLRPRRRPVHRRGVQPGQRGRRSGRPVRQRGRPDPPQAGRGRS